MLTVWRWAALVVAIVLALGVTADWVVSHPDWTQAQLLRERWPWYLVIGALVVLVMPIKERRC